MTKNNIHHKIEDSKNKKGFFVKILVIMLLVIAAIYLFYHNKNESAINDPKLVTEQSEQIPTDSNNNTAENDAIVEHECQHVSFGPTMAEIEEQIANEDNPYEADLEAKERLEARQDIKNEVMPTPAPASDAKEYEDYLINANLLLAKYIANKSYKTELDIMRQHELPQEFDDILSALAEYDNLLNNSSDENITIPLFAFSQFVKITKEAQSAQGANLQGKIKTSIEYLMDYISSRQMQVQFGK